MRLCNTVIIKPFIVTNVWLLFTCDELVRFLNVMFVLLVIIVTTKKIIDICKFFRFHNDCFFFFILSFLKISYITKGPKGKPRSSNNTLPANK